MSVILSLLERASIAVVVVVVGAGEGRLLASLGRPRTILRCNIMLLVMGLSPGPQSHAVGTDQCAIFRIVAISTIFSTCHCLSSIITAWHLSSLKRTSIVSYYSLRASSRSRILLGYTIVGLCNMHGHQKGVAAGLGEQQKLIIILKFHKVHVINHK